MKYWTGAIGFLAIVAMQAVASPSDIVSDTTAPRSWWEDSPWGDPDRGFNWYPDQIKAPSAEKPGATKAPPPKTIYEMSNMEDITKEVKRLRDEAILNPTDRNVHVYLKAQAWVMEKSAVFADTARRVVWANPDVDYNNKSPVVTAARQKIGPRMLVGRKTTLKELASGDYGLVFFARSDCPYCHDQAPILKIFEREYGMQVLAISMDGGDIPEFPEAKPDNGISMVASSGQGISTVPAVYLINRVTKESIPLGTGVLAADEIAERIRVITRTKPGEEF